MKNPIIDIILEDNTNKDLNKNAQWIRNVIIATMTPLKFKSPSNVTIPFRDTLALTTSFSLSDW
jgi:hypothetical protein